MSKTRMSSVCVLFVKDDSVYFTKLHYRNLNSILAQGIETILPALKSSFLDAGYMVVDVNRKEIINGQRAVALKSEKGWDVLDV